jgi:hypothetical protein
MSIVLQGSTSGSCTLQEQAVAGTTVLTLPTTSGTILTTGSSGQSIPKAALPTGSVLQVVQTYFTTSFSTTSTSYVDVTGLSSSITPTSSSSKILVMLTAGVDSYNTQLMMAMTRNGSLIGQSTAGSTFNGIGSWWGNNSGSQNSTVATNYLDSPATTSSTTYQVQVCRNGGSANAVTVGSSYAGAYGVTCSLTLLEIAA